MLIKHKKCENCHYYCNELCFYDIDDNKQVEPKKLPKDNYCDKYRNDFDDAFPEF